MGLDNDATKMVPEGLRQHLPRQVQLTYYCDCGSKVNIRVPTENAGSILLVQCERRGCFNTMKLLTVLDVNPT